MSLGGNLTYQIRPILINALSVEDFGVFTNAATSQKEFLFKKDSLSLPYKNAAGTIVSSVTKVAGKDAVKKVALALLGTSCPCAECNYEFGFQLVSNVKNPGILNSERYPQITPYFGTLPTVDCTAGSIDETSLSKMRKDIIGAISNHVPYSRLGKAAPAFASVAKIITWDEDDTIIINGGTITQGSAIATAITNINTATTTDGVKAYQLPTSIAADKIVIIAKPGATELTLTGTSTADANIYIGLVAKDGDVSFEVTGPKNSVSSITIVPGSFSVMTADDVFREFSQMRHAGHLLSMVRPSGANNVAYTKYIFKELMPTAAIHGASHGDDYLKEVHVYIPTSALGTDVWDADDYMTETGDSGFTADTTFDELIAAWKS